METEKVVIENVLKFKLGLVTFIEGKCKEFENLMGIDMGPSSGTQDFVVINEGVEVTCMEGNGDLYFEENGIQGLIELTKGQIVVLRSYWNLETRFSFRASDSTNLSVVLKFSDTVDKCLNHTPKWF